MDRRRYPSTIPHRDAGRPDRAGSQPDPSDLGGRRQQVQRGRYQPVGHRPHRRDPVGPVGPGAEGDQGLRHRPGHRGPDVECRGHPGGRRKGPGLTGPVRRMGVGRPGTQRPARHRIQPQVQLPGPPRLHPTRRAALPRSGRVVRSTSPPAGRSSPSAGRAVGRAVSCRGRGKDSRDGDRGDGTEAVGQGPQTGGRGPQSHAGTVRTRVAADLPPGRTAVGLQRRPDHQPPAAVRGRGCFPRLGRRGHDAHRLRTAGGLPAGSPRL